MYVYSYKRLEVWKLSMELTRLSYKICKSLPETERFGLKDQLRRASTSIPLNISEGSARESIKDQMRFLNIAFASLMEVDCIIEIVKSLEYLDKEDFEAAQLKINELANKLNALRKRKRELNR